MLTHSGNDGLERNVSGSGGPTPYATIALAEAGSGDHGELIEITGEVNDWANGLYRRLKTVNSKNVFDGSASLVMRVEWADRLLDFEQGASGDDFRIISNRYAGGDSIADWIADVTDITNESAGSYTLDDNGDEDSFRFLTTGGSGDSPRLGFQTTSDSTSHGGPMLLVMDVRTVARAAARLQGAHVVQFYDAALRNSNHALMGSMNGALGQWGWQVSTTVYNGTLTSGRIVEPPSASDWRRLYILVGYKMDGSGDYGKNVYYEAWDHQGGRSSLYNLSNPRTGCAHGTTGSNSGNAASRNAVWFQTYTNSSQTAEAHLGFAMGFRLKDSNT